MNVFVDDVIEVCESESGAVIASDSRGDCVSTSLSRALTGIEFVSDGRQAFQSVDGAFYRAPACGVLMLLYRHLGQFPRQDVAFVGHRHEVVAKGGVRKTTIVAKFAGSLAQQDLDVFVVNADHQVRLTEALGHLNVRSRAAHAVRRALRSARAVTS